MLFLLSLNPRLTFRKLALLATALSCLASSTSATIITNSILSPIFPDEPTFVADGQAVEIELILTQPIPIGTLWIIASFGWTAFSTGGVSIHSWEPGPASIPIGTGPNLFWTFSSSVEHIGGPGSVISGDETGSASLVTDGRDPI